MKKVIIIGTVHLNWTPHNELIEEVAKHAPDRVFIELTKKEVREKSNRDEMFAVLDYAQKTNVDYKLFDINEPILKEGVTGKEKGFVEYENTVKQLLGEYDWKDLNNEEPWQIPEVDELQEYLKTTYFDKEKIKNREQKIAKNINRELVEGNNVIVTGAGHITHLLKDFSGSVAPLRNS